ncbi:MAG TPA: hypothetical protein ENI58_01660 [Nitrospirae bacterium]|nr:hypothetical protein [Nitrospirota bacterium]
MAHSLNIVAVRNTPENENNPAVILGEIIGTTAYEAGSRLRAAGRFPVIVAVYAEPASADETAAKLRSAGFRAVVLSHDDIESDTRRFIVRNFFFDDMQLRVESREGETILLDYGLIEIILRGTYIEQVTETTIEKGKKLSLGLAVISGGLVMRKSFEKHHVDTSENREGFLNLYDSMRRIIVLRENALVYSSLGSRLQPTRTANFAFITAELKRRCPYASYDESLLNRLAQSQILGPLFNPAEDADIAISLTAKSLRRKQ